MLQELVLHRFSELPRNLSIIKNNSLLTICELRYLISIGGSIIIDGQPELTSLEGLDNLNPESISGLQISNNTSLSNCCVQSICDYLASPNGTIEIENNGTGCSSPDEVKEACGTISLDGQIIHVPNDHPTIQDGINAASDGDTVLVAENRYFENIRFMGKAITVASEFVLDGDTSHIAKTIIDGSQPEDPDSASVVFFVHGEDTTSIINGFTITGGTGVFEVFHQGRAGGGVYSWKSGCKIINNIIMDNHVEAFEQLTGGAGIACAKDTGEYWAVIENNIISNNTASAHGSQSFGGGITTLISVIIRNNLIENNTCTNSDGATDGGGMEIENKPGSTDIAIIDGNIIRYNRLEGTSWSGGAGFSLFGFLHGAEITNNKIEGNTAIADENINGGGIFIYNTTNCLIENNHLHNNSTTGKTKVEDIKISPDGLHII